MVKVKNLAELDIPHMKGRISHLNGDRLMVGRLMEMGLHPGLELEFIGKAPFNGPRLFRFGSTVLALREEEVLCVAL